MGKEKKVAQKISWRKGVLTIINPNAPVFQIKNIVFNTLLRIDKRKNIVYHYGIQ